MYESYWKLERNPFADHAEPAFLYRSHTHQSALLKLRYLVENHKGAGLLVGNIGTGKTFLTEVLSNELPEGFGSVVRVVFPQLTASEFLAYLAVELGTDAETVFRGEESCDVTVRLIQQRLQQCTAENQRRVIVIDEAHLIEDRKVLQALQLLLNFHQPGQTEFSLIFSGEQTLLGQIERMGQLDERIAVKCMLHPLTRDESAQYIAHRLEQAGTTATIFDQSALAAIHELSGGIPRRINRLCDLSLLVGYADSLESISETEIESVAAELTLASAA